MQVFLETDRLALRRFTEADVDSLYHLHNDPDVMRFLNGGKPTSREVIEYETLPRFLSYDERFAGYGYWAAVEKSTGAFVGWFAFCPLEGGDPDDVALGYRLHKAAWGKGYGTEGARALIRRGFTELGARRVWAWTMAVNTRSRRVMEKVGLAHVRTFYEEWDDPLPGTEHGEVEYALTKADWEQQQGAWGAAGSSRPAGNESPVE